MDMSLKPFSPDDRSLVLETLVNALRADPRICGIILVGSGAIGFIDEFSDLDFCVVVNDASSLLEVFEDWGDRLKALLPVLAHDKVDKSASNYLHILLLDNLLEIDMGFLPFSAVRAAKPRWKIIHDTTGELVERMQASWDSIKQSSPNLHKLLTDALPEAWYSLLHALIAIKRGQLWRANFEISCARDLAITLHGARFGLVTKRWRDLDGFDPEFRAHLEASLPKGLDIVSLSTASLSVANIFLSELDAYERLLGKATSVEREVLLRLVRMIETILTNERAR